MLTGQSAPASNTDLPDSRLSAIVIAATGIALVGLIVTSAFPGDLGRSGGPLLQSAAIGGTLLLGLSFVAVLRKKAGHPGKAGFRSHVWLASAGTVLVAIHSTGSMLKIPSLLLVALVGLIGLGVWSRLVGSKRMARTFGTKMAGFSRPDETVRARLAQLISEKQDLLRTIAPAAQEATFSLQPRHWLATPGRAFAYHRAVMEEHRLIGTRATVSPAQAYWRIVHRLLAWGFVVGLLIHIVTVTFFAGYVADGRVIYWWHLAEWGS
ncbi:MAG: hypothetical protein P8N43_01715 [Alphaproteobacteria bacterium]|nr:hypothetical protein [Alphaproteobacteria bacterium]